MLIKLSSHAAICNQLQSLVDQCDPRESFKQQFYFIIFFYYLPLYHQNLLEMDSSKLACKFYFLLQNNSSRDMSVLSHDMAPSSCFLRFDSHGLLLNTFLTL